MSAIKNVWIINHYTTIPSRDRHAGRHYFLAKGLLNRGWRTTLIAASTQHPAGTQTHKWYQARSVAREGLLSIIWLRANAYRGNGGARMLNMLSFTLMLLLPGALRGVPRPDVIIGSSVHPFAAWAAARLARRYRVPFVFEPRDLWPDSLIALNRLNPDSLQAKLMRRIERYLFRSAKLVVSPLPGVGKYMARGGVSEDKFVWVSNGIDIPGVLPPVEVMESDTFTFGYFGAMGNANALETILNAFDRAYAVRGDKTLALRLVGAGPDRDRLQNLASTLKSSAHIRFEPAVPKDQVLDVAAECDCLVANMKNLDVYEFGVSLNKLYDYLLVARPIIFASNAMNNPVREAGAGICVAADDVEAIADAMDRVASMQATERAQFGRNGRAYVTENNDYAGLSARLATALDQVVAVSTPAG